MGILRNLLTSLIKSLKKIKLIDKCLIIFMIILMAESIYNLFSNEANSHNANDIDIIIRTTSAAIFGYFLSGNFIRKSKNTLKNSFKGTEILDKNSISSNDEKPITLLKEDITNQKDLIKFTYDQAHTFADNDENTIEEYENDSKTESNASNQQIIIATIIGLTALIVLIIARNYLTLTETSLVTISQMRDFVSGCVGFLLGCPTKINTK